MQSAEKCRGKWKYERKNIRCEILYVVTVCMSGLFLEDQKVWDDTGLVEIKITCFLFVLQEEVDK